MSFFQIKDCDVNAVEKQIQKRLEERLIPQRVDIELQDRCTADDFLKRYYSRPAERFKIFCNQLPPWVYAIGKVLPFYSFIRKRLLMSFKKR